MIRIEPTLLDYHSAAIQLDRKTFCQRFKHPVLVSTSADLGELGESFQTAKTSADIIPLRRGQGSPELGDTSPVLSVQPSRPGINFQVTLGRKEENDIVLNHETVSGKQAMFRGNPGAESYTVEDVGSTNPTQLNHTDLQARQRVSLRNGDVLTFGRLDFVFYYPGGLYDALAEAPEESLY
ncbi:MAG: FHA domain-containing protein [Deltaproteobacteria bacterium]|nr:FHA domain-containing protein [Deltaproteobacteria bacterium]